MDMCKFRFVTSPDSTSAVTRMQGLLDNSLSLLTDAIQQIGSRGMAMDKHMNIRNAQDLEKTSQEIQDRAERLGLVLNLMDEEINRLPDTTNSLDEVERTIGALQQLNDGAASELRVLHENLKMAYENVIGAIKLAKAS